MGFYVMVASWGRTGSVAWYATEEEAQAEVDRMLMVGQWSGGVPPWAETDNPCSGSRKKVGRMNTCNECGEQVMAHRGYAKVH